MGVEPLTSYCVKRADTLLAKPPNLIIYYNFTIILYSHIKMYYFVYNFYIFVYTS